MKDNPRLKRAWKTDQQQQELRQTYGIQDNKTIVVERKNILTNTLRVVLKASGGIARFTAAAVLAALALIGLATLVYPNTRAELLVNIGQAFEQLHQYLT